MKRTPLHHHHVEAAAIWTARQGWEIPASYGDSDSEVTRAQAGAGLADVSYLQKLQCPDAEPGAFRLTERKFFLMGEPPLDHPAGALDVTSIYACFILAGPASRSVLGNLTSLNLSENSLPNRTCRQTSLAHVHAAIIRDDLKSTLSYKLLVTRDYGEFVWDSILHAGRQFGIVRVGVEAVDRL